MCNSLILSHSLHSVDLAELEPPTRGVKKLVTPLNRSNEQTDDLDVFRFAPDDIETEMDTSQHGDGLANANKELFAVQHHGKCNMA